MGEPSWGPVGGRQLLGCPPPSVLGQKPHPRRQAPHPRRSVDGPVATTTATSPWGPRGRTWGPSEAASSSPSLPTSNGSINVEHQVLLWVPFSEFHASYDKAVGKIRTQLQSKEDVCSSETEGEGAWGGLAPPWQPWAQRGSLWPSRPASGQSLAKRLRPGSCGGSEGIPARTGHDQGVGGV